MEYMEYKVDHNRFKLIASGEANHYSSVVVQATMQFLGLHGLEELEEVTDSTIEFLVDAKVLVKKEAA